MQYRCSVIHNTRFFIDSQLKKYFIIANMHFFYKASDAIFQLSFVFPTQVSQDGIQAQWSWLDFLGWSPPDPPYLITTLCFPKYILLIFQDIFGVTSVRKWFSTPFRASIPANFTFIYFGIQGETSRIHQIVQPGTAPDEPQPVSLG